MRKNNYPSTCTFTYCIKEYIYSWAKMLRIIPYKEKRYKLSASYRKIFKLKNRIQIHLNINIAYKLSKHDSNVSEKNYTVEYFSNSVLRIFFFSKNIFPDRIETKPNKKKSNDPVFQILNYVVQFR